MEFDKKNVKGWAPGILSEIENKKLYRREYCTEG